MSSVIRKWQIDHMPTVYYLATDESTRSTNGATEYKDMSAMVLIFRGGECKFAAIYKYFPPVQLLPPVVTIYPRRISMPLRLSSSLRLQKQHRRFLDRRSPPSTS